jgi:hypothetical protein
MDVAADGSVIDRETPARTDDVTGRSAGDNSQGCRWREDQYIARDEIRAELKDGKIIKLDSPKYAYEADLEKGKQVGEVVVTPEGQ